MCLESIGTAHNFCGNKHHKCIFLSFKCNELDRKYAPTVDIEQGVHGAGKRPSMGLVGELMACAPVCTGLYWLAGTTQDLQDFGILSGNYILAATKLQANLMLC